ncbi:MAG: phosphatidate cytidylyltransferase [Sphingobium sp.]
MAEPAATTPKKSDLGVRVISAIGMLALAGTAFWLGGWIFRAFVALVGVGVLYEWWALVSRITASAFSRILWLAGGFLYVGIACYHLALVGPSMALLPVLGVIGTDVGAYFAGRAIGGPKIAPAISPSKTWAGLGGGIFGAAMMMSLLVAAFYWGSGAGAIPSDLVILAGTIGIPLAVLAQAGDFFESWMKRKAGVKDSGSLIPGHGGLFDRVDGLLPVSIVTPFLMNMLLSGTRL